MIATSPYSPPIALNTVLAFLAAFGTPGRVVIKPLLMEECLFARLPREVEIAITALQIFIWILGILFTGSSTPTATTATATDTATATATTAILGHVVARHIFCVEAKVHRGTAGA